jgi:hypothetical protein
MRHIYTDALHVAEGMLCGLAVFVALAVAWWWLGWRS